MSELLKPGKLFVVHFHQGALEFNDRLFVVIRHLDPVLFTNNFKTSGPIVLNKLDMLIEMGFIVEVKNFYYDGVRSTIQLSKIELYDFNDQSWLKIVE